MDVSSALDGLDLHEHACWSYTSDGAHRSLLTSYLTAGLARNERVLFFGYPLERCATVADDLLAAGVPVAELTARGQLALAPATDQYIVDGRFDPDQRIQAYAAEVLAAVDAGYRGLRVAAEVPWLRPVPAGWQHWSEYELRADVLASRLPFSALCAYNARLWPAEELAVLAAVHGISAADAPPEAGTGFRLYAQRDGSVGLAGELDITHAGRVRELLVAAAGDSATPVLDVAGLEFVDVAGLRAVLAACQTMARTHGRTTIRGASRAFRRVWDLLDLDRLERAIVME
jgi:anti-anti-sigma factor